MNRVISLVRYTAQIRRGKGGLWSGKGLYSRGVFHHGDVGKTVKKGMTPFH